MKNITDMSQENWKNHPIYIATLAVASTIAVGVLLYKEVILPTHTLSLRNEISSLRNDLSEESSNKKVIAKLKNENDILKHKVARAEVGNLLLPNNPYPPGLDLVRIGDSAAKVEEVYASDKYGDVSIEIQPDNGYITVKHAHTEFRYVTYYLDEENPKLPVSHIGFSGFDSPLSSVDLLQEKLVGSLGNPDSSPRPGFYSWDSEFNTTVYKSRSNGYLLMERGYLPGYWPKAKNDSGQSKI